MPSINYYVFPGMKWDKIHVDFKALEKANKNKAQFQRIISLVCDQFQLTEKTLLSKYRYRNIVDARRTLCYVANELCKVCKSEIGVLMGKDHTTVIHLIKTAKNLIQTDEEFANTVYQVAQKAIA